MTRSQNKRLRNRHLLSSNRCSPRIEVTPKHKNQEASRGCNFRGNSQGRGGSRSADEALCPSRRFRRADRLWDASRVSAAPASVSGVVRDSAGVPQIGAEVQLLRPDLSVVASVYTNSQGRFTIASILPGRYALKAMGASFLPSLRENAAPARRPHVVNLTLNTLYEVMQWLPAEPRTGSTPTTTTGPGRCARLPTGRCCAGLKMGRWWWFPTAGALPS